jgi:GT2 family glycosyltransferase
MIEVQSAGIVFQRGDLDRKVAVVVPLHNYASLIEEALASVAAQTYDDLALIVVDDASTDDSRAVAEQWMRDLVAPPHLTLVLLANETNAGLSVTRNTGIGFSRSEYCFFLDADNVLLPRCIEKHVRALDARADCIGAYSIIEEFGGESRIIGANVFSRERLKRGNYIDAMIMIRRDALEKMDGFHPIRHGWEDYELWLRLCEENEQLLHLPEVLSRYRHHNKSMLRRQTNVSQNILDLHRNIEELHPWVQLDAPRQHFLPGTIAARRAAGQQAMASGATSISESAQLPGGQASAPNDPYKQYEKRIFSKLDELAHRKPLPVDVEIDTDYTGPVHATPFDSFLSPRQRDDSIKHTIRMLQLGIVGINPRPGVHAARDENGDFIRYRSILAQEEVVERLPSSMLIHIHAFYPDVVEEMLDCFVGKAQHGRFLVTTTTRKNHEAVRRILEEREFSGAETILIENKGRDIGPFLDHAVSYASAGDVICHVHTKKSPDVGGTYGEKWRKLLYGALLTQTAVDAFDDDSLGLLFPDTSRSVGWGKNRPFCEEIAANMGRTLKSHPGPMPIGNMFFVRVETAQAMREATKDMEWPREPVPYDGTVLHAIERMWTLACEQANLQWAAVYARHDEKEATPKATRSTRTPRAKR